MRTGLRTLCLLAPHSGFAQNTRPESPPFNASMMEMQAPPAQGVAIRAGRLFDPKSGTNLTNQVIVIKGDRITDVGPADRVQIPQGARIIDLSKATVLPGLIDRHVHLMQDQQPNDGRAAMIGLHYALMNFNAGFTTLQDMGRPSPTPPSNCATPSIKAWCRARDCRSPGRNSIRAARLTTPRPPCRRHSGRARRSNWQLRT